MSLRINLNRLVFCIVFYQGIIGILSKKDFGESSDILLRQKRVISLVPGEDVRVAIKSVPYIVLIKIFRSQIHCPGTILSTRVVITSFKCVELPNHAYRVYSGTSRVQLNGPYRSHVIRDKRTFLRGHPFRKEDGVALITVDPPFTFNSFTESISLYEGNLSPGTLVTVSGWGCHEEEPFGTEHPDNLRSITVPIISFQQCANIYQRIFAITEADICTLEETGRRYCAVNDGGAPLVVKVNLVPHLAGVHLWNGGVAGRVNPDVFINLQDHSYKTWIAENMHSLQANVGNPSLHNHG